MNILETYIKRSLFEVFWKKSQKNINTLDDLIKILNILNNIKSYNINFNINKIETDLRKKQ